MKIIASVIEDGVKQPPRFHDADVIVSEDGHTGKASMSLLNAASAEAVFWLTLETVEKAIQDLERKKEKTDPCATTITVDENGIKLWEANPSEAPLYWVSEKAVCICEITAHGKADNPECPECFPKKEPDN